MTRWTRAAVALLAAVGPSALAAQDPQWTTCTDSAGASSCGARILPRAVRAELEALYNAAATRRERGPFMLPADSSVAAGLAVIGGPVRIAGTVRGALLVLNGDVEFAAGARVVGEIAVLGGVARNADSTGASSVSVDPQRVSYSLEDGRLHLDAAYDNLAALLGLGDTRRKLGLRLAMTNTYNRAEGLPIEFGPRLRRQFQGASVAADLFGIFRTGDKLEWTGANVGYDANLAVRFGGGERWTVGARLFDVVAPVEAWQLSGVELGLATFLLHSDYADYYDRHGYAGYVGYFDGRAWRTELSLGEERWGDRATLDPIALIRNDDAWRENPAMDDGRIKLATLLWSYDTRTDPERPRSGWWIRGEYELANGVLRDRETERPNGVIAGRTDITYGRSLLDARRYLRVSRQAQLNARVLLAGWLHGDPLPMQRRFSMSGPAALSGYDFRSFAGTQDVLQCAPTPNVRAGSPALCDRIALASVDYRRDLKWLVDLFGGRRLVRRDRSGIAGWVAFADAGRGWLAEPVDRTAPAAGGAANAWKASLGLGLELGQGGVYMAGPVGDGARGVNWFLRLTRRY
jgi:hypothetical protein